MFGRRRLPGRERAYTPGFTAGGLGFLRPAGTEARELRLVSQVLPDRRTLLAEAHALAAGIAAKSPLAVCGTKRVLLYQRCARCPCRAPVAARVLLRPRGDGCFMQ